MSIFGLRVSTILAFARFPPLGETTCFTLSDATPPLLPIPRAAVFLGRTLDAQQVVDHQVGLARFPLDAGHQARIDVQGQGQGQSQDQGQGDRIAMNHLTSR